MYKITSVLIMLLLFTSPTFAQVEFSGFLQGLYGGRLDDSNPTATQYTASETRLQLRMEHFGDNAEFFGRIDFTHDGSDLQEYNWELREGYVKFRLGNNLDFKVGRQILTWGTGDLIFINDVFVKDYLSFFIGRDDQYLKAPQDALKMEYYNPIGALSLVWSPRFEPNRLPTGRRLSFYDPMSGDIVGANAMGSVNAPKAKIKNSELAARLSRQIGNFNTAFYFYHGFYRNPLGFDTTLMSAIYPRLNIYGVSTRGTIVSGILWIEGGYLHSVEDEDGDDPIMPNSALTGLIGFERQIATNLTANIQWQANLMFDHETYQQQQIAGERYVRNEIHHLLTTRVTKLLYQELLMLSGFVFYSPSDEDTYVRLNVEYKYTDEIKIAIGGNIFDGKEIATEFGQFQKNDNIYAKISYGF